jgi:hypothetical protein
MSWKGGEKQMDFEIVKGLIDVQFMVVLAALWVIGFFLKGSPIPNWTIPYILGILGIIGTCALSLKIDAPTIVQGILCAGFSVYTHQLKKQGTEKG